MNGRSEWRFMMLCEHSGRITLRGPESSVADFLSGANPKNWPQAEMRSMMHDHLNLTKELVARLHGDWTGDVAAYDAVHQQILHMADGLSMGIINQFPNKFD